MATNKYQSSSYFKYMSYVILLFASTIILAADYNVLDNFYQQYTIWPVWNKLGIHEELFFIIK